MSTKKPVPVQTLPTPRLCPVCKKPSYSQSGVHPQCSQRSNELLARQLQLSERSLENPGPLH
jgi:hypothetical protein